MSARRCIALLLVAALATTLHDTPAVAAPAARNKPPAVTPIEPVPTVDIRPGGAPVPPPVPDGTQRPAPVWPAAGATEVSTVEAAPARVGGLPVWVGRAAGSPDRVRVEVLDRAQTAAAGVRGLLLRVSGAAELTVDYRGFRNAYGADWASRLRLVDVSSGRVLPSRNDWVAGSVSGTIPGAGLLAVTAGASGPAGDYKATSLQQSSTWSAGGSSGDFSWSYPMRSPPAAGGPSPGVTLSYSAQSVDGRQPANNNQPSIVGEGFELSAGGYIERRYRSCNDDKAGGNNSSLDVGDQCWATDNATLSLAGHSGELLYNATEGRWHLRGDDGSRVQRFTGAANGDDNGEHWVVTTTDGTQYWFGLNRLPGWASGKPETASTWTAPVFGNHAGEPCHATSFANSSCTQAWRWNLDYVVDIHKNTMSLWYATETNKYARNNATTNPVSYVRAGWLDHLDYGTDQRTASTDSVFTGLPPARVALGYADRCLASCSIHDGTHWTDTPWDQECTGSPCDNIGPTFWTTRRLSTVTTQVWDPGASALRNVERWTLTHSFPNPGDTNRAGLWLDRLAHVGLAGGQNTTMPDVEFTPVALNNRVDGVDFATSMNWHRLARIRTESGGTVSVTYSGSDCTATGPKPTPHANNRRCYPVKWKPDGFTTPVQDWFHKYVVTDIVEADNTGGVPPFGSPRVAYHYSYLGDPAWHYTDDDGIIGPEYKTWSVWRGYGTVGVTMGDPGEQTYSTTRYFRGMHGDKQPTGSRTVVIDGINDEDWWAGSVREQITYNGPGGAEVSATVNTPWASAPTATRTINGDTVHARFTNTAIVVNRTALDGGRPARQTRVTTSFDGYGMPITVDDEGDLAVTDDQQCTRTVYEPRNTTAWVVEAEHREQRFAVGCAQPVADENDVISDVKSSYDNQAWGTAPSKGDETLVQQADAWNAGNPTFVTVSGTSYDAHGRSVDTWDALNRHTLTAYTPSTGGPVTARTDTNPLLHETRANLDPAFGSPTSTVDPNGKRTDLAYDGLGRLTAVWTPGRDRATQTANFTFAYLLRNDAPTVVTTAKLLPSGSGYVTTYALLDGMLRSRQTQSPSPSGGRILTDIFYDTVGRAVRSYGAYYDNRGPAGTTLVRPADPTDVPNQTRSVFDGTGRATDEIFQPYTVERWRTRTSYGGDHTDVTPPAGGTATSTVVDVDGRTVAFRQFQAPTPTGPSDTTTYTYDRKGQLTSVTDPVGNHWDSTFDLLGRQRTMVDPDKGTTTLTYDNAGQITSTTDARNKKLVYTYDALGRKTAVYLTAVVGTARARWTYDTVAKGYLTSSIRNIGSSSYVDEIVSYNDLYEPTEHRITVPPSEVGLDGVYTYRSGYLADGSPDWSTVPAAGDLPGESLDYHYDQTLGLPIWLSTVYGTSEFSYVSDTRYNALGLIDQLTLHTGLFSGTGYKTWLAYAREPDTNRLTRIVTQRESGTPATVADLNYTYDNAGNITRISDTATSDHQCFRQDYLQRLTEAWTPASGSCAANPTPSGLGGPARYWLSWAYDKTGNRLNQVDHATPAGDVTTTYTYPAAGGPRPHTVTGTSTTDNTGTRTASYTYDTAGNTLGRPTAAAGPQTLTWDPEGHLETSTDSTGTTTYVYDADGNRLVRRDPTGKTLYLPGQELRYTTTTGARTCTRYYGYRSSTIASRTAAGLTWFGGDHQGTQQTAIDAVSQATTTRRQTPFGTPRGAQPGWPNSKGFVGGTVDNTGLVHLGAREYDPSIGRFVSVDPFVDQNDPQQMHGYSYASGSPVTSSDPDGLAPTICLDVCGGADDRAFQAEMNRSRAEKRAEEKRQRRYECRKFGECGATYDVPGPGATPKAPSQPKKEPKKEAKKNWWNKAVDWVKDHKAQIIGIGAGLLVASACMAITMGAGSLACGALAGAVGGAVTAAVEGKGLKDIVVSAVIGGVFGALGAGVGFVLGEAAGAAAGTFARSAGSFAARAASSARAGTSVGKLATKELVGQDARQLFTAAGVKSLRLTHQSLRTLALPRHPGSARVPGLVQRSAHVYKGIVQESWPSISGELGGGVLADVIKHKVFH